MKPALKKVGIGFGVFFGLILLAIVILPFVIDVDHYRPQIVQAANDHINGKLEMGKLTLSLWGQIRVTVDGFSLSDAKGRKVVSAKDVFFHVPLGPLITGKPVLTFKMTRPELVVVKDKAGKMNVMSLMKDTTNAPKAAEEAKAGPTKLPSLAVKARLGIEMKDAMLSYKDEATDLVSQVKDLNVLLENLSLSHPTDISVWANLDTRMGQSLSLKGPAKLTGRLDPRFNGSEFQDATLMFKADMDGVGIAFGTLFDKKPGVATNADGAFKVSMKALEIEKSTMRFHNAVVDASGKVTEMDVNPKLDVHVKSNEIQLKPWSELVPMLKEYELGGSATLAADLSGSAVDPRYRADVRAIAVTAKAPNLKQQPRIDAAVKVITDQVESMTMTMKAPGNDLKITGKVVSFTKPKVDLLVTSTGMDLDALIDFPKPPPKGAKGQEAPAAKTAATEDFDAMLAPMRENPMLAATVVSARANLTQIKIYGIKMTDINAVMGFRDLALSLDPFRMNLWDGKIAASMGAQMKPKTPTYRFSGDVAGLDLQQAVSSQLELFKNTVIGKASFHMDATGASFNPDAAKGNLNGRGTMKVEHAQFHSIDVGKMASEAINKSLNDIAAKVPPLKGKTVPVLKTDSRYEVISSDFTIQSGQFHAPNFAAKSEPNKGIDLKGDTVVGIKDYSLSAAWQLIDTYNLTKARDLSVETNGVRVDHILADGNNPVTFPVRVTGTCFAPVTNYTAVPEALGKVAIANMGRAVEGKAKAEVQKQVQNQLNKVKAPEPVQNAIQGLGKKLFGK